MNKMASNFNNRLLEALETISGLRGNPELHAVRKRDLEPVRKKIYATSVLATETLKATEENTYQLTDESDGTILSRIIEAKARAEEVAEEAALVDEKAQAVRDDHDALVDGFVGKLSDAFDGVDADIDAVGVDVSSIVCRAGSMVAHSSGRKSAERLRPKPPTPLTQLPTMRRCRPMPSN